MTQEQQALQASLRDWAKRAGTIAVTRARGDVTALMNDLAALGVFAIAQDGTVTDLAAALEELARALTPGPVLPAALASLLTGQPATVALTPGTLTGALAGSLAGSLGVTGETGPVLWAGGPLLAPAITADGDAWFLLGQDRPGVTVTKLPPVDLSRDLATIRLDGVLPDQPLDLTTERVRDLAATLFAAEAAGLAAWCSGTASGYAGIRRQFGRPIGSFQAVKHLCATMACRAERAAALAWDAARTADDAPDEHPFAAAAAAALALDDAVDNAKDCIQVLGGIGFTWEHDAHLYLRRALALRQLLGGSRPWRTRLARLAAGGARRTITTPAAPEKSLYPGIGAWAGPAIEKYGSQAQQDRFLGPTRRGEITWCQLFSEPEAGSDLASLRTRAERTDSGWLLTGQKVWTSLARQADWAICLARTDPGAPKHDGISYFLVDMHAPGIDIRPLREITGRTMFNEVFLDDVFVPHDCVLGAPGGGWRIAMSTLATERVAIGETGPVDELLAAVTPEYAERAGFHVASAHAVALLGERGAHPAIRKLLGTGHRQAVAETALELLGPDGAAEGEASQEFLLTRCLSIAGGTTQILLTQVAERVLGLPR
jgi:alkylation response protein AidB-like acyl-CoA dehydrogenase